MAAGALDTFAVYVWSVKTGRVLDVLAGHEGPVCALAFSPTLPILASASWDKTVRLWDVFAGKGCTESLPHTHDVLALAFRPDGKQMCSATLDGQLYFWDPVDGVLEGTIGALLPPTMIPRFTFSFVFHWNEMSCALLTPLVRVWPRLQRVGETSRGGGWFLTGAATRTRPLASASRLCATALTARFFSREAARSTSACTM